MNEDKSFRTMFAGFAIACNAFLAISLLALSFYSVWRSFSILIVSFVIAAVAGAYFYWRLKQRKIITWYSILVLQALLLLLAITALVVDRLDNNTGVVFAVYFLPMLFSLNYGHFARLSSESQP
jgi:phosphatidylserine synthase